MEGIYENPLGVVANLGLVYNNDVEEDITDDVDVDAVLLLPFFKYPIELKFLFL